MKTIGTLALDWNWRNQPWQANPGSGVVFTMYDVRGQRVRKVTVAGNGAVSERSYLGAYEVYRERQASGAAVTVERRTLDLGDGQRRIALVELLTTGTAATTNSVNDGPAQLVRYQIGNHLGSSVGGLYYNAARYDLPWLGRWCSADPAKFEHARISQPRGAISMSYLSRRDLPSLDMR